MIKRKRKSAKERLEDILDDSVEELLKNPDSEPFDIEPRKTGIIVTPKQITKEIQSYQSTNSVATIPESSEENDFEFARTTLYNLVQKASVATDGILGVCEEGGNPRAFEVAGQLLKITAEIARDIMGLRKTKVEINKFKLPGDDIPSDITKESQGGNTIILQATTAQIIDSVREARKKKEDK